MSKTRLHVSSLRDKGICEEERILKALARNGGRGSVDRIVDLVNRDGGKILDYNSIKSFLNSSGKIIKKNISGIFSYELKDTPLNQVRLIKKKPSRIIPDVGSNADVLQEIDRYCSEIDKEVNYIRARASSKSYNLVDGVFIYSEEQNGYYQFPNYQFLNFAQDTGAVFKIQSSTKYGFISFCSHEYIEICIQSFTGPVDSLSMEVDASRLAKALSDNVRSLNTNNPMLKMLVDAGKHHKNKNGNPDTGFDSVKRKVEDGFISVVWGPPGTGKTFTLANLAIDYMKKGKRVLIMSQSNISVDGAILKIIDIANQNKEYDSMIGKVFRYGMAREPGLYANEDFCARLYIRNKNPLVKEVLSDADTVLRLPDRKESAVKGEGVLLSTIERLLKHPNLRKNEKERLYEIQDTLRTKYCPLNWMKQVAQEIRAFCNVMLVEEEGKLIQKASIIATTATKATITDKIKDMKWDIVFFDEVSMALIPQIMIASTLARERLVLLGDFRQLAPIVQHNPSSILRNDVFKYLNITDGKGGVSNHPWLIMLDEQRRMHPDIAEFISDNLYDGRIKTSDGVKDRVQPITEGSPFAGSALAMVDHSGFQALCYTTRFGSRYNPLSAVISLKYALEALDNSKLSIGIITPYQAQARLLAAMVKDAEITMNRKLDILCSTVHQFQGFEKDLIIFDTVESEPKRMTGKLFVDGESIDDATRLVNVAVTRARSKFLVVANYAFLTDHYSEIPPEMRKLLNLTKSRSQIKEEEFFSFITDRKQDESVSCFKSDEEAAPVLLETVKNGNLTKKLTYWHSSRNHLKDSTHFHSSNFIEMMREAKKTWKSVSACNGSTANPPVFSRVIFPSFNPSDDYLIGEETFVWFGIPYATNKNYGKRIPYVMRGKNATSVFEMLCDHEWARKEWNTYKKNKQLANTGFSKYLSKQFDCPKCMKGAQVNKTTKGKYIVVCPICSNVLNPYVPKKIIEEYMFANDIRCEVCGAELKISNYWKPYCSISWSHECCVTLDQVFSND